MNTNQKHCTNHWNTLTFKLFPTIKVFQLVDTFAICICYKWFQIARFPLSILIDFEKSYFYTEFIRHSSLITLFLFLISVLHVSIIQNLINPPNIPQKKIDSLYTLKYNNLINIYHSYLFISRYPIKKYSIISQKGIK